MDLTISPGKPLIGETILSGDKSLSHRAALFAALAEGESRIDNFLISGVTRAMLQALSALGVAWDLQEKTLTVRGIGLRRFKTPISPLNCGNSATTIRLLTGAIAASGVEAVLDGSDGLRRRPMARVVEPLSMMGVPIFAAENGGCPLTLGKRYSDKPLKAVTYNQPAASAQVKTCLILASLAADGKTTLTEPVLSRDHSERMLRSMGVSIDSWQEADGKASLSLTPPVHPLTPIRMSLPADPSAAAFLIVAALITPGSDVFLPGVLLNPTRSGLIEALRKMGGQVEVHHLHNQNDEPVGDLRIRACNLQGTDINGSLVVDMIDEFPAFAVAAIFASGVTRVSEAQELRYKESDRITALVNGLKQIGASVEETPDGFVIEGQGGVVGGSKVAAQGDHRLAMSFALAGLASQKPITVTGTEIINESFPNFAETLARLGASVQS